MSDDMHSVPLDRVLDLVRGLGIDPVSPETLRYVYIGPGRIEVVRFRLNEAGEKYLVGFESEAATETVTIKIEVP